MKKMFSLLFLAAATAICFAGTARALESKKPEILAASITANSGLIKWEWNPPELYENGGWNVQFYGTRLSIKPGFVRGDFDASSGKWNMLPVARITDITDVNYGEVAIYPYIFAGAPAKCYAAPTGTFYFAFTDKSLTVATCKNGKPDYSFAETITYKQWLDTWTRNALKYCDAVIKDYCFIPQEITSKDGTAKHGFVASKGSPLSEIGGLPADFMEVKISSAGANSWVVAPIIDSPPLRLAFKRVRKMGQGPYLWRIFEMTKDEEVEAAKKWKGEEQQIITFTSGSIEPVPSLGRWSLPGR